MVKLKASSHYQIDGLMDAEKWLDHLATIRTPNEVRLVRHAVNLCQLAGDEKIAPYGYSFLQQGLMMAEILLDLNLDVETIAASLVFANVESQGITLEDVADHLGNTVAHLVSAVSHLSSIGIWQKSQTIHIENARKMLLALVQDVRAVFIKLAERLTLLRLSDKVDEKIKKQLGQEVMDIYAPLANRLGLGQLKWELEDLSFRYLEPSTYKKLAKLLDAKRVDREKYISDLIIQLKKILETHGLTHFEITGRAKHIYSIYRKMQRKDVDYERIYDVSAVRVMVDNTDQCYAVLGLVHELWSSIPQEFDDYISHPKPNGYRSLHTAVIGPQHKNVEVQIRTYEMHQESELGVAAHWMYKEGARNLSGYEVKIAWLREMIAWQKEMATSGNIPEEQQNQVFSDRVYVFTPQGDIIDLPAGSTPLDFAYQIHSEVGHRCRGAKVNSVMVPLTHGLSTGERVEIITGREASPSRDWLNPSYGYIKTARARAKVHHWFKQQDYDRYIEEGEDALERELRHLGLHSVNLDLIAGQLNFKSANDMLAALGCGDIRLNQITHLLQKPVEKQSEISPVVPLKEKSKASTKGLTISGINNVLMFTAKCCKPVPGDDIIGFITKTRGVAIHRVDCHNIVRIKHDHDNLDDASRIVEVQWNEEESAKYPVDIYVVAHDRTGLVRDITTLIALEKINLINLSTRVCRGLAHVSLTVEVSHLEQLMRAIEKLMQLPNIVSVNRLIKG